MVSWKREEVLHAPLCNCEPCNAVAPRALGHRLPEFVVCMTEQLQGLRGPLALISSSSSVAFPPLYVLASPATLRLAGLAAIAVCPGGG